jgi:hypothetical protein
MKQKGRIKFTATELIDELYRLNARLFEQVLDTISDAHLESSCTWEHGEDGNMILLEEEE